MGVTNPPRSGGGRLSIRFRSTPCAAFTSARPGISSHCWRRPQYRPAAAACPTNGLDGRATAPRSCCSRCPRWGGRSAASPGRWHAPAMPTDHVERDLTHNEPVPSSTMAQSCERPARRFPSPQRFLVEARPCDPIADVPERRPHAERLPACLLATCWPASS